MSTIGWGELQEIVEVVWMTVLDLPVEEGFEPDLAPCNTVTAKINISGAWHGHVLVKASEQFLSCAAALMFSTAEGEVNDTDRADTLTELTNMLGGTVKCLLPETCDLSLPVVVQEEPDVSDDSWAYFLCGDHPLAVAVVEAIGDARQAA